MTSPLPTPPGADDESVLARRAREGDAAAFEALYRSTGGRVFALCLRMTHDRERARELTHDVFVLAWQKLPGFREEAAFTTWLHRLAVNLVLQALRGERRRSAHELPEAALEEGEVAREEGRAMLQLVRPDEGSRIDLETAIGRLPPNARQVFVLHEVEGYRHEEIAQAMGIAEGTVRAHLHRARRLLMEFLS